MTLMSECPYCGPEPVSHWMLWTNEAISMPMHPFDRLGSGSFVHQAWDIGSPWLAKLFFGLMRLIGLSSYNTDLAAIYSPRAKVLWEEAERRGIPIRSIRFLGKELDIYEAKVNGHWMLFNGLPRRMARRGDALWWMDDKAILKKRLAAAHIPVPRGGAAMSLRSGLKTFNRIDKPVIVKPRFGSRGRHTLTFLKTETEFTQAFKIAKQLCPWVIVEEHLEGDVYRGTVIGGKLVGVLGGAPPRVTGDGFSTIQELINKKDSERTKGVGMVRMTPHTHEFLARLGFTTQSILPLGQTIDLTEKIGVRYGGSSEELENYHPKIKLVLEDAARVLKNPILGFDFIVADITKDPSQQKWGIIECNSMPFINLHYDPLVGATNNVAKDVWDLVQSPSSM
jgi:D-alanine-D-alanine ligase-like ATP-grasp enzyme